MSTDSYETARERASGEIAEIDMQVQRLNRRRGQLEKLIELLKELNAEPIAGVTAAESPGNSSPCAAEDARTLAAHLEMLNEYEQAQARNGMEISAAHTGHDGQPIPAEEIARLAYRYWNERGRAPGHDDEDWLRAERELRRASAAN